MFAGACLASVLCFYTALYVIRGGVSLDPCFIISWHMVFHYMVTCSNAITCCNVAVKLSLLHSFLENNVMIVSCYGI